MGKRSNFKRSKSDFYVTPMSAVLPLLPFLETRTRFCEPCAGDGALIRHLEAQGHKCIDAWDTEPRAVGIGKQDARIVKAKRIACFITNPPWTRHLLHPIIKNLSAQRPTWILIDADWMHTRQANGLWQTCALVVSVGRVKWIKDSPFVGKDNCCWYRFDPGHKRGPKFIGRSNV